MNISLLLLAGCLVLLQSSSYAQVKKSNLMLPRQRCMMYCPFGNDPNKACGCLSGPGRRDLCSSKICGKGERCVQRQGIARCIPNSQIYPIPGPFPGRRGACQQPKVVGRCRAANRRYFFNQKTRMCEPFIYGGCGGNDNNFKSLAKCQKRCPGGGLFDFGQGGGRGNFGRGGGRSDFGRGGRGGALGRGNFGRGGARGGGQGDFGRGLGRGDFGSSGFGRGDGKRGGRRGDFGRGGRRGDGQRGGRRGDGQRGGRRGDGQRGGRRGDGQRGGRRGDFGRGGGRGDFGRGGRGRGDGSWDRRQFNRKNDD